MEKKDKKKINLFRFVIILAIFFTTTIYYSCTDNIEVRQIKKMIGKKISFNMNLLEIRRDTITIFDKSTMENKIKIITYSDISSCTDCMLGSNLLLERLIDSLHIPADLYIITYPVGDSLLFSYVNKVKAKYTILYDSDNSFLKKNNLQNTLARNRTMLLDDDNKIIIIGEPLRNNKIADLYLMVARELALKKK